MRTSDRHGAGLAPVAAVVLVMAACGRGDTSSRGWSWTADFADRATLEEGIDSLRALEAAVRERGFERIGTGSTGTSDGVERIEHRYATEDDELGPVTLTVWWWTGLRAEGPETGVGLTGALPAEEPVYPPWEELVEWVRGYADPTRW